MRRWLPLLLAAACSSADELPLPRAASPFPPMPVPAQTAVTPARVELGRLLFHDPILSSDRKVACVTCHGQIWGMSDGLPRSIGIGGVGPAGTGRTGPTHTRRNASSLWNAAWREGLLWDGRARSLEEQILAPLADATELGRSADDVARDLAAIPAYAAMFAEAFPGERAPINAANLLRAIATFERTLVSDHAPWDRLQRGDALALDARETLGWQRFVARGCDTCHAPPLFEREAYARGATASGDDGRSEVTGRPEDRGTFRVPTLRNVRESAPYFHDGSVATLEEAVSVEARVRGDGTPMPEEERDAIVAFLRGGLTDRSREPARPDSVPSGLAVPVDGYRIPR